MKEILNIKYFILQWSKVFEITQTEFKKNYKSSFYYYGNDKEWLEIIIVDLQRNKIAPVVEYLMSQPDSSKITFKRLLFLIAIFSICIFILYIIYIKFVVPNAPTTPNAPDTQTISQEPVIVPDIPLENQVVLSDPIPQNYENVPDNWIIASYDYESDKINTDLQKQILTLDTQLHLCNLKQNELNYEIESIKSKNITPQIETYNICDKKDTIYYNIGKDVYNTCKNNTDNPTCQKYLLDNYIIDDSK